MDAAAFQPFPPAFMLLGQRQDRQPVAPTITVRSQTCIRATADSFVHTKTLTDVALMSALFRLALCVRFLFLNPLA